MDTATPITPEIVAATQAGQPVPSGTWIVTKTILMPGQLSDVARPTELEL